MWLFAKKSKPLSGFYPEGRKSFQFSFDSEAGGDKSCEHLSGNVSWTVYMESTEYVNGKTEVELKLKCLPKNENVDADWSVVADNTIKLLNPDEPNKTRLLLSTQTTFGQETFSSVTFALDDSMGEFKDDDDKLCVQVEIGLKSINKLKGCTDFTLQSKNDATFLVDDVKFHAGIERVRDSSPVFISEWKDLPESSEIRIENCTPESFSVFLKMLFDQSFHIELEDVGNLLDFGKKYEIELIKEKCEKFLQTSINDDAELIKVADKYGMQNVITERLASIHSLRQLAEAFKYYRRFSDDTMRLLMKKFVDMP